MVTICLLVLTLADARPCVQLAAEFKTQSQTRKARVDGDGETWVQQMKDGRWSVALFNTGTKTISLDVVWTELGLPERVKVRDVWKNRERGVVHGGFAEKLGPGACALFQVSR
jgi:hypothetical protein